jgi:tripartite-type tricarboxylate transporter receptor subunit TctC
MNFHSPAMLARRAALSGLLALTVTSAGAEGVLKLIVPAPAGGTMDVVARLVADQLSADSRQPVVVENRPGAGGLIAAQALLAAPADGQTLMVSASNVLTEIPHVVKTRFDPLKDVKPVIAVARSSLLLVGAPGLEAKDLKAVISHVKQHPGQMSYASYGIGTVSQFAGIILNQKAGLDLQHVAFPGSPPALTQVIGGQIPLMFDGMVTSLPYIKSGKVQVYAIAASSRSPLLPQVPTFAELGYPDIDFNNWVGVIVPSGMAQAVVDRVYAAVSKAATSPRVRDRLAASGFDVVPPAPSDALAQSVRADHERYGKIVKTFDIKLQ